MKKEDYFTQQWSKEIEAHRKQLFWVYRLQINFPQEPYSPEEITAYVEKVTPYLYSSTRIRILMVVMVIIASLSSMLTYDNTVQQTYQKRVDEAIFMAETVGFFDVEAPQYRYREEDVLLLEKNVLLYPRVSELREVAQKIDMDLDIKVPYIEEKLKNLEYEVYHIQSYINMGKTYKEARALVDFEKEYKLENILLKRKTDSFYIMKYEVTTKLYKIYASLHERKECPLCPVSRGVSLHDAAQFANQLSQKYGLEACYIFKPTSHRYQPKILSVDLCSGWRLPTDQEWTYAAMGGDNYIYSGSDNFDEVAWGRDNTTSIQHVGQKKPNGYGLYDMSGNVYEWIWDIHKRSYWLETRRRGGSIAEPEKWSQISTRSYGKSLYTRNLRDTGFRLVRSKMD